MHVKVKNELFGMYTIDILFARRICKQNKVYCFTFVLQFFLQIHLLHKLKKQRFTELHYI